MTQTIQIRRGQKADLPILNDGEFGLCADTSEVYIGNNNINVPVNAGSIGSFIVSDGEPIDKSVLWFDI